MAIKHGMAGTKVYEVWQQMIQRCRNPSCRSYPQYGGRGIQVCERWSSFPNFFADMGRPPPNRLLERIDNNGNYEPANCKWATAKEQQQNTRFNRLLTHGGITQCVSEWSRTTGIHHGTIFARIRRGWSVEEILTLPPIPPEGCRGRLSPRRKQHGNA